MSAAFKPIKDWAPDDRPREKLWNKGKLALSNAELLTILIGTGTRSRNALELAKHILNSCENDLNKLARLSIKELMQIEGIGQAKAIIINAAIELGSRRQASEIRIKKQLSSSKLVYEYALPFVIGLNYEQFWVLYLDRSNKVIAEKMISEGGVSEVHVDVKKILRYGLEYNASSIICFHNHPSGNTLPSKADLRLTNKLKESGKLIDLLLHDHLIVTENNYYSFADEAML